jgi:hypothetical protein
MFTSGRDWIGLNILISPRGDILKTHFRARAGLHIAYLKKTKKGIPKFQKKLKKILVVGKYISHNRVKFQFYIYCTLGYTKMTNSDCFRDYENVYYAQIYIFIIFV